MKTHKLLVIAAILGMVAVGTSCGNGAQKKTTDETTAAQSAVLEVDNLLATADANIDKEIVVEGVCTHICQHSGRKLFMMGSDDTQTIRVESGKMGQFDQKCANSIVKVTGILKEERIDEAYLQNWEAQLKAKAAEEHGDGEAGCDTEKQARGETANSPEARIADFRAKIAKRNEETGKDYLSFYYVEASSYEIQ